jgi:hypothetical protein
MQPLKEWAGVKATYPKKKARTKVLKKTLRRFPMESETASAQLLNVMSLPLLLDGHAGDRKGDARRMHTTYARESSHHASAQWRKALQRSRGEWKRTNSSLR